MLQILLWSQTQTALCEDLWCQEPLNHTEKRSINVGFQELPKPWLEGILKEYFKLEMGNDDF